MEMRARDDTPMAQDLIPSTPPLAAALHDRFLSSHCSSCFLPIPQTPPAFSCPTCHSLSYCSLTCLHSDLPLHHSSRECLLQPRPSACHSDDSADLRAALRLRQTLGPGSPRRIAGLSVENLEAVLGSGSDMESRVREGAAVMRGARGEEGEGMEEEEEVLWAVLTNAVEVQVGEGSALGIGVYGPWFSWFNHSCSPNACYRFEVGSSRLDSCGSVSLRVSPASNGEATDLKNQENETFVSLNRLDVCDDERALADGGSVRRQTTGELEGVEGDDINWATMQATTAGRRRAADKADGRVACQELRGELEVDWSGGGGDRGGIGAA